MKDIVQLGVYETREGKRYHCFYLPAEKMARAEAEAFGPFNTAKNAKSLKTSYSVSAKSVKRARDNLAAEIGPGKFE